MINFCTLFDSYYLDKALALYESLEKVSQDYCLYIFCFDDKSYEVLQRMNLNHVVLTHHTSIETKTLLELKQKRSKAEYCWTCTPVIVEYVLDNFPVNDCTYIDADLFFFYDPQVLFDEIRKAKANVVITEHRFPDNAFGKKWMKKSGKYCVEFNYFDQSVNARKALCWWKEKCFEWCYAIYEPDKMGDQKYLEQFLEMFDGVHELQHLGGGVAPWNIQKYQLDTNKHEGIWLKEKEKSFPLVFYHFQNIRYLSGMLVNINSGSHDYLLKRTIYVPYLHTIEKWRATLKKEYGIEFIVSKSCSSNRFKAFLEKKFMKLKVKSLSDLIYLDKLD